MTDPLVDFFRRRVFDRRRRKVKDDYVLALDIGTEFVKALLFRIEKMKGGDGERRVGAVVGLSKQRQKRGNMIAGTIADINGVVDVCRRALVEVTKSVKARPHKTIVGVAGECVKGMTSNFIFQRGNSEEEIEFSEIQNIIQKAQWKAYQVMRKELALETCRPEVEIKPINALLGDVRIDGYRVTNPVGFTGKEIYLSIFNVYASLVHLQAIEKIASELGLELLSITAQSYALARSLAFDPSGGAIFIDIGGGTTDIALVRGGRVESIRSVSLAGRSFTKRISRALNLGLEQAEEVKMRHSRKELSRIVQGRLKRLLKRDVFVWFRGVELVLESFDQDGLFPPLVLVCGGGSLLPEIRKILECQEMRDYWRQKFNFESDLEISFAKPEDIRNIVDTTGRLEGAQMVTPIALAGLGLELAASGEKTLPPIFRRAMRMMR